MINLLIDDLPKSINVDGMTIEVETDFKKWVKMETVFETEKDQKKQMEALLLLVKEKGLKKINGDNVQRMTGELIKFFNCGEEIKGESNENAPKPVRVYSFNTDQFRIFSDFKRYYDIDLMSTGLHWWLFKQLLFELPDESSFKRVLGFRTIEITSKMSPAQKQYYARMKSKYALEQQKLDAGSIGSILGGGSSRKK